jgi:CubicO group peptidase (beta-lactamase class C family)
MVATVIALAGGGRLSLDDPVAARVPELGGGGWAQDATLQDLLANRSGLPLLAGLEILEGAGHVPWVDTPDRYWPRIIEFIGSTTGRERIEA